MNVRNATILAMNMPLVTILKEIMNVSVNLVLMEMELTVKVIKLFFCFEFHISVYVLYYIQRLFMNVYIDDHIFCEALVS